jgi:hypothetical protein
MKIITKNKLGSIYFNKLDYEDNDGYYYLDYFNDINFEKYFKDNISIIYTDICGEEVFDSTVFYFNEFFKTGKVNIYVISGLVDFANVLVAANNYKEANNIISETIDNILIDIKHTIKRQHEINRKSEKESNKQKISELKRQLKELELLESHNVDTLLKRTKKKKLAHKKKTNKIYH